jgi:hypothetical protein
MNFLVWNDFDNFSLHIDLQLKDEEVEGDDEDLVLEEDERVQGGLGVNVPWVCQPSSEVRVIESQLHYYVADCEQNLP